ncbi:hypothetical protein Q3G72_003209 [Acer saccharum]|nr:hypothetical protein Q3G72_003209 [Acer saccharum]
MERVAAVKIPVVSQNEDGNGSLPSGSSLNPATGEFSNHRNNNSSQNRSGSADCAREMSHLLLVFFVSFLSDKSRTECLKCTSQWKANNRDIFEIFNYGPKISD